MAAAVAAGPALSAVAAKLHHKTGSATGTPKAATARATRRRGSVREVTQALHPATAAAGRNCFLSLSPPRLRSSVIAAAGDAGENLDAVVGMGLSAEEVAMLLASGDENVLTTALSRSIAVEDYALAAKLSACRKTLQGVGDEPVGEILDWRALGMAEWLCARAEMLGFRYPTAVQRRTSMAFFKKKDVVIQAQTGSGKTLAYLMPTIDNMEFTARRMLQILIVVPSRELTIQTVMLTYRLFGGNTNVGIPGDPGNMFNYTGPQGIKVVGVFSEEHETRVGFAETAEIVVGTPESLARMKRAGRLEVDLATTIIADEADQLFEMHPEAMAELLAPSPFAPVMEDRQVVLCGVNVPEEVVALCEQRGHLTAPMAVSMGNPGRVPASVVHRRLVVPRMRKIIALARQIRADLRAAGEDAPPPRTIIFVPSAAAAEAAAIPLRKSLWNQHQLAVLLPQGKEAVRTVLDFKNLKATLLLCTPEVERGLDMPGVDYVYSLDAPTTAASYLHRAGRCGRLGATSRGVVTSIVTPEEEETLDQAMNDLEINSWLTLEEPQTTSRMSAAAAEAAREVAAPDDERAEEGDGGAGADEAEGEGGGFGNGEGAADEEERALTASTLNDIFYTLDAFSVNQLEDIFNSQDATKEAWENWEESELENEEDRQEEEMSEKQRKARDDIRKIFDADVSDEDSLGSVTGS